MLKLDRYRNDLKMKLICTFGHLGFGRKDQVTVIRDATNWGGANDPTISELNESQLIAVLTEIGAEIPLRMDREEQPA